MIFVDKDGTPSFDAPPKAGQALEIVAHVAGFAISIIADGRLLKRTPPCPDPPCHEIVEIDPNLAGATMEIVVESARGLRRTTVVIDRP